MWGISGASCENNCIDSSLCNYSYSWISNSNPSGSMKNVNFFPVKSSYRIGSVSIPFAFNSFTSIIFSDYLETKQIYIEVFWFFIVASNNCNMMNGIKHFLSSLRNIIHPVIRLSSETLFYHAAVFLATFFISFNFYLVGEGGCRTKNSH